MNQTSIALIEKKQNPKQIINKSPFFHLQFEDKSQVHVPVYDAMEMFHIENNMQSAPYCKVYDLIPQQLCYQAGLCLAEREFNSYNGSKIVQSCIVLSTIGFNYLLVKDYQALAILICPSKMDVEGLFLPAIDFSQMIQCFC